MTHHPNRGGIKPIIEKQNTQADRLIEPRIVIDAKSGVSGAGRQAKLALNYAETTDNFKAYSVEGHRHLPEIEQGVAQLLGSQFTHRIRFLPHLVPMIRGMLSSIHMEMTEAGTAIDWQQAFENAYASEPFMMSCPKAIIQIRSVRASNRLRIAIHQDNERAELTVIVVQDNLVKGAAGQAVQNMNVMFGLEESLGLNFAPIVP